MINILGPHFTSKTKWKIKERKRELYFMIIIFDVFVKNNDYLRLFGFFAFTLFSYEN